ncbi:TPP2-like protein [Mya arenaria]|uniref:Tripeptidyl-peptidase 2 n=1 Tax=Mya arenaria TaxID=6604 RepID=A0ABY7G493_MYAAR|nr:TPP2-like protein [Mya arenaria]
MASTVDIDFPVDGILPKKETGAASFLVKYPDFDGRNVLIAILDTGVDPGAPGLQKTTTGDAKIVDLIDATGSGDVETTTVVEVKEGRVTGLTGRTLMVHLGVKIVYELYPRILRDRICKERREKTWDPLTREAIAQATKALEEFDAAHTNPNQEEKQERENLQAEVDILTDMDKKYSDCGPVYDCVVFNDGETWRACIDTSEQDKLNYSFNIYNDGNVLEIVTNAGSHGTHVACITAGHFPDNPERNGVAPGAQIIGVKIGDSRLGSMETGTALVRAMIKVQEYGCDLINYSYGEASHWSNSGHDGALGVDISAPGGAIASVPNWTLKNCQLMNGTSMSSPNACGCIALVLSGLKARDVSYNPYSVKRALQNTAKPVEGVEVFAMGYGLVQVEKAYDYLCEYEGVAECKTQFTVSCSGFGSGIYIREPIDLEKPSIVAVTIDPVHYEGITDNEEKINFCLQLSLTCDASFVQCPSHLELMNCTRSVSIKVDPRGLPEGVHFTEVCGYDIRCVERGPVFRIPVTVIVPVRVTDTSDYVMKYDNMSFKPGQIRRHFIHVPEGANVAVLRVQSTDLEKSCRMLLHAVQVLPQFQYKKLEFEKFHAGDSVCRFDLRSYLKTEDVSPSVSLKTLSVPLRPIDNKIRCLAGTRDTLPEGRQIYSLELTYKFSVSKTVEVTPDLSVLSDLLYECEYESQIWMLFDSNKQLLGSGDAYPHQYNVKLDKGDYTVLFQIRHDKKSTLERVKSAVLLMNYKLSSPLTFDLVPLAKTATPGSYLSGTLTLLKEEPAKKASAIPFKYVITEAGKKASKSANGKDKDKGENSEEKSKSMEEKFMEAQRDLKISWLSKLDIGHTLYRELKAEFEDHIPLYIARLNAIDSEKDREKCIPEIIETARLVLSKIDQQSVLAYFGMKSDNSAEAASIKTKKEEKKVEIMTSLLKLGLAQADVLLNGWSVEGVTAGELDTTVTELAKWVEPTDSKVLLLSIKHAMVHQQYGRALKLTLKEWDDKPSKDAGIKVLELYEKLGWDHCHHYFSNWLLVKFPPAYRPF